MASIPQDGSEQSAQVLLELVGSVAFSAGKILVPGCGTGHDVLSLAGPSHVVTGLDAPSRAPDALERPARFDRLREAAGIPRSFVRYVVGDFFTWSSDTGFAVIWDAGFLATIEPARRPAWAVRVHDLLADRGELAVLMYPTVLRMRPDRGDRGDRGDRADRHRFDRPELPVEARPISGPPYAIDPGELDALLAGGFHREVLAPVARSHPARQGKEWLGRWRKR